MGSESSDHGEYEGEEGARTLSPHECLHGRCRAQRDVPFLYHGTTDGSYYRLETQKEEKGKDPIFYSHFYVFKICAIIVSLFSNFLIDVTRIIGRL